MPKAIYVQDGEVTNSEVYADGGVYINRMSTAASGVRNSAIIADVNEALWVYFSTAGTIENNVCETYGYHPTTKPAATIGVEGGSRANVFNNYSYASYSPCIYSASAATQIKNNFVEGGSSGPVGNAARGAAIYQDDSTHNEIVGNHVLYANGNGIVARTQNRSEINANIIYDTGFNGIYIYNGGTHVDVQSNIIHDTGNRLGTLTENSGIYIQNANNISATANQVSAPGDAGIHADGGYAIDVSDNVIEGTASFTEPHIKITDVTNPTIKDNQLTFRGHIRVIDSASPVIEGNMFSGVNDADFGASSAAVFLSGTTRALVKDNVLAVPDITSETGLPYDYGIVITGSTSTRLGWNDFKPATSYLSNSGSSTEEFDLREFSFGTDQGVLNDGSGSQPYPYTGTGEVVYARAVVGIAPAGADLVVDINRNGASMWSSSASQPTVDANLYDSGLVPIDQNGSVSDGDIFTLDIDQVGSSTPGGFLTVVLYVRQEGG